VRGAHAHTHRDREQAAKLARIREELVRKMADEKAEIVRWRRDISQVFVDLHKYAEATLPA
jgi:hypothetical protein